MREISVRQATKADFEQWWELRKRALALHPGSFGMSAEDAEATPLEEARRRFEDVSIAGDNSVFVALDETDRIVGVTGVYREQGRKEVHRAGIWGVYVDPDARGLGIGRKLMDAAVSYARTIPGVLQLELTVASDNPSAVSLYRGAGFVQYGRHPRGLMIGGEPIDEDLMVLILDEPTMSNGNHNHGETNDRRQ